MSAPREQGPPPEFRTGMPAELHAELAPNDPSDRPFEPPPDRPRLGLAAFSRRLLVRGVFMLLALATLALAVSVLRNEKERSLRSYDQSFAKTQAEIMARLRHPAGQLALLNPRRGAPGTSATPLRPLLLPYSAIDFDDPFKSQQAVETAGCEVRLRGGARVCAGVGHNPYSGGFIYLVGRLDTQALVARDGASVDLQGVHRALVSVSLRGQTLDWVAPFELLDGAPEGGLRGRLTGYALSDGPGGEPSPAQRPDREFRGWMWQAPGCAQPQVNTDLGSCARQTTLSLRVPVQAWRDALFGRQRPQWPPPDLDQTVVRLRLLGPGEGIAPSPVLLDTDSPDATAPMALADLRRSLLPGETLRIRRVGDRVGEIATLHGDEDEGERTAPWLLRLIARLPVDVAEPSPEELTRSELVDTPLGRHEVVLEGNARAIERNLAAAATRLSWYVAAMLGAIVLAWLVIELGLLRQVSLLARRAAAVSSDVGTRRIDKSLDESLDRRLAALDLSDLRGRDELGILAGALADLLGRVREDVRREHARANQDREMWHAVGHEIMSPLQSLMVLHPDAADPARRHVQRMQQAVRVQYGQASPSEALRSAALSMQALDLDEFLRHVAANAGYAGIADVRHDGPGEPVRVQADEFGLEDVFTHLLRNADRHREPGTPIMLALRVDGSWAVAEVRNTGPRIPPGMLERIFEYGVSGDADDAGEADAAARPASDPSRRGQGLFVARTYLMKMGGDIGAVNEAGGVCFRLRLPLASHT